MVPDTQEQTLLRQQTVLARFGEFALKSEDLDEILTEACRLVGEAMGTELAKVVELQPDGETLLVRAGIGWQPGVVGHCRLHLRDGTSEAYSIQAAGPVISTDITKERRFRLPAFLIDHGVKALVNVTILGASGSPPFGMLQVDSREPRQFTGGDVDFLRSYANLLASAVARLRMFEGIRRSEARLRASLDRQEAALETGVIGFFTWDLPSGTITADKRFARFYGLDPDALAGGMPLEAIMRHIHPEDRAAVEAGTAKALQSVDSYVKEFRLIHPDGVIRWVMVRGHCYAQAEGRPICYTGTAVDVTALKESEAALRRVNEALEARVADRTHALSEANARLQAEAAARERVQYALQQAHRMETVVAHLPIGAGLVAPSGRIIVGNPEFQRLLPRAGIPSTEPLARTEWLGWHPDGRMIAPEDFPGARALRGELALNIDFLHREVGQSGHWRRVSGIPIHGEANEVVAALIVIVDVHQEKLASERQALLTREVDHRAKNMLAVVQAALRLTRAPDTESFIRAIEGRVAALARAQTLLSADRWAGADLHRVLEGELAAFLGHEASGPQARLDGPRLVLPPGAAQPFSMAIHELATNAIKYGALSAPTGRLAITWSLDTGCDVLRLRWQETGGPRLEGPPRRLGFGSRVLAGTLRDQLGGRIAVEWKETGLVCDIEVALARLRQAAPI
ncbi:HWE histidine kinase domain-containing protein [Belnapia rosea]|uniref:HWE histidine kinase domain-containing protein n=1 Tax=Belnapia rosea TaxID=938405 RepID=UPI00088F9907|nr:HWE histidine kinase domain-containing protein [Belnapia rosea]SDB68805.1 PAS domain S-box-containing protein [Belnapia rosea]